jgi:hypothetical protein
MRDARLHLWSLAIAALTAIPGCKLPAPLNPFAIGAKSTAANADPASAASPTGKTSPAMPQQQIAYPGVQTSYQTPVYKTSAIACGFG